MQYKIKKGLIFEKKGKKIAIFDPEKSTIYELNETAAIIFNKLKLREGEVDIKKHLLNKFKVNEKIIDEQMAKIIKDLLRKKILVLD